MRIALAQAQGVAADVEANLATVRRLAAAAARAGARLAVFPEAFLTGYAIGAERLQALAEPLDGPAVAALGAIAREHDLAILCGHAERLAGGAGVANAAVLVGPDGALLAAHRKCHLFGELDREAFVPGEELTLVTIDDLTIGILVCYDVEFPEAVRALAAAGAQLIAVPTALMAPAHDVAEVLVPARALENQVFVAYVNRVGAEGALTYLGRSMLAGPTGERTTAPTTGEHLLVADVDPAAMARARGRLHYLAERRPGLPVRTPTPPRIPA